QIAKCKLQIGKTAERPIKQICLYVQFAICSFLFPVGIFLFLSSPIQAHPLLNKFYERTVDVYLSTDAAGRVVVEVKYQLEVNQLIALLDAKILLEQHKEEEPGNAREYYDAFTRLHAPILADRLYVILDDKAMDLSVIERKSELNRQDGTLHSTFL